MKKSKYEVIKAIMESNRINEHEQAYYMEKFIKGELTVNDIKWIWE